MIKLDVQEYCHGCANFTADVKEPEKYYAGFDIIEMTDTIVHLDSGMMVNWYKHLGRTNTCSQSNRTIEDYYKFFKLFKEELDYWEKRRR